MLRSLFFIISIFISITAFSQEKILLKGNTVFLPVGVFNFAAEKQIKKNYTLQGELFISPWKSFATHQAQIYMLGIDGRYYFGENFKKWYLGANISYMRFIVQKMNYWSDVPYQFDENSPVYITSDLYQDGYSFIFGAVGGYQWELNEKWNLDFYLGVGNSQAVYKGYHEKLKIRYDDPNKTNRSGEWIPYKGGIMLVYKLN